MPGNLVTNCDFATAVDGWRRRSARQSGALETTTFQPSDGNPAGSMSVTSTGDSLTGFPADPSYCLTGVSGHTAFQVSFDARSAAGTLISCHTLAEGYSGTTCDGMIGSNVLGDTTQVSATWHTFQGTAGVNQAAPSVLFTIDCSYTDQTGDFRVDNVIVLPI